jgi:hypothetical protein
LELIEDSNGKHTQNRAKIKDINAGGWIEAKKGPLSGDESRRVQMSNI